MASFPDPRGAHPYHMHEMIRGQPRFLRETLRMVEASDVESFLGSPRRIVMTGCGTSYHAATYGARVLRRVLPSVPVEAVHAYDLLTARWPLARTTVVGVSHSGATPTTNRALARAGRRGARTLAVVGLPGSPVESLATRTLVIGSTHDASWAATMSYTTQLAALAGVALRHAPASGDGAARAWRGLPIRVAAALGCEGAVRRLAKPVVARGRVTFLGSGLDDITALEGALKIRETCSLPASGYHPEQFLHGPFEGLDPSDAVVALRSREDGDRAAAILRACARTGAYARFVGEAESADIRLPRTHALLRPAVSVVPLQFLAYYAALERGTNPDVMRTDVPRYREGVDLLFR